VQFVLAGQWALLREYCHSKKIQLIGDIPIYVNDDSVDVWSNPTIFKLDENFNPRFVAGVPPDYFSQTGQRWGNPVYDWDVLKETDYDWWMMRLEHNLELFDVIRIDHFRGLVDYWEIPASEPTAVKGEWRDGPGDDFLNAVLENFPHLPLIAEDLGILSPQVPETMERFRFPGMKILLFAFGGELEANPYPPEKYIPNCVAYTGTHDNNTIYGWWCQDASMHEKKNLAFYLRKHKIKRHGPLHWLFIKMIADSDANLVLFPLQDVLGMGAEGRMNSPGTAHGNWEWRFAEKTVSSATVKKFKQLTEDAKRG
jgi:4-alpha-glucanotransferase